MKEIAFFDIDGTLYGFDGTSHRIPHSTVLAIQKFRERGILAFICTGRPMRFI
ncbi:HAD hydrolase family protein [Clostridium sp. C2-6-12]|uniref:HAD family hydrolase n=1 Tax=Clostridium sp. C2-6-12 TaxID=2698832 RepID=UPI001FAB8AFE|nr:HAD hydrolase family protein [Clostridium sp. C2-6-12]